MNKRWQKVKRLLVIRLDNMGDVVMTTPAMRAVKETWPQIQLTLLASKVGAGIAPYVPEIDEVITYEAPWMRTYGRRPKTAEFQAMVKKLANKKFDGAIIFTVYSQNPLSAAMLAYLADIPLRLGYSHHNPYELLTDWVPDPEPFKFVRHEVERQLDLVKTIGAETSNTKLSIKIYKKEHQYVMELLKRNGINPHSEWLILSPGSREARRCYPLSQYMAAMKMLIKQWPGKVVITGIKDEMVWAGRMMKQLGKRGLVLTGKLGIGELLALIEAAPLVITNNSGPAHLAAALGTPVVDLYARTNPQHTPWQVPTKILAYDVPCRDCERGICTRPEHPPVRMVEPGRIVQAALSLLTKEKADE